MNWDVTICNACTSLFSKPVPPQISRQGKGGVLLLGEAPGREESEEGRPFVGAAGKTLNSILYMSGFHRQDFHITNVLKCRPPNNRDPLPEEIEMCKKWLIKEIQELQPEFIVCLGLFASVTMTGKSLTYRGSIVPSILEGAKDIPCLITWHPAYVMRNRTEFSTIIHDLQKINPQNRPPDYLLEYLINPEIPQARAIIESWQPWLEENKWGLAVDIETSGEGKDDALHPWRGDVLGAAIAGPPGKAIHFTFSLQHPERWLFFKEVLENPSFEFIFQNNTFDRCFLEVKGVKTKTPIWDTMDAMHVIYSASPKSLDHLRSLYTNLEPYKKAYKKGGLVDHLEERDLAMYNCLDVDVTTRSGLQQRRYMDPKQGKCLTDLLLQDTLAIKMRRHGIWIDKEELARNYLELQPESARIADEFLTKYGVDPNSPKQLTEFLYKTMKMPEPPLKKGRLTVSTDEAALIWIKDHTLVQDDLAICDELIHYREVTKVLDTFVIGVHKWIEDDGRIHPEWVPTGTDTGRWGCRKPNCQNLPESVRAQFASPPGKVLFYADYTQLELLVALTLAGDEETAQLMLQGLDIHEMIRLEMEKFHPTTRVRAKAVVFGTIYGLSDHEGAKRFRVPKSIVRGWQEICYARFPKLVQLCEKHKQFFRDNGYIETAFGRRKYCEMAGEALNHPIQGTAAMITHRAALALDKAGYNVMFNGHDAIACEEVEGEKSLEEFQHIISHSAPELREVFPCKAHIGTSLKDPKRDVSKRGVGAH